uniref:Selenoprotein T n=1 Tax=Kryptolebias marmoratus TaxID=37003 RepID=A0A3Q3B5K3_KRYMA
MAEFGSTGLLAVLLFFTALTLRDIYTVRSNLRPDSSPDTEPNLEPGKPAKAALYTGPVLLFRYCKVFQEYSNAISQVYPDIRIQGENYPPTPFNRYVGNLISYLKLLSILLIISGQNPFHLLGHDTPAVWTWTQNNKIFSCLMAFFICNMMETHFLSTGAFEVTLNDVPVWSKLQSGYVPNIREMFQILDTHLKMNQVDHRTFTST